jgi:hypothetical protein
MLGNQESENWKRDKRSDKADTYTSDNVDGRATN